MLLDASVARNLAVLGWSHHLIVACEGRILVADGVHSRDPDGPSELRGIRDALTRQANEAPPGSGLASRALSAVVGLDQLLNLDPSSLKVLTPTDDEFAIAVRLQSRNQVDRNWRRAMGARSRRLDAGESVSIAIAVTRTLRFASDDEDALTIWAAMAGTAALRTRDVLRQLVHLKASLPAQTTLDASAG